MHDFRPTKKKRDVEENLLSHSMISESKRRNSQNPMQNQYRSIQTLDPILENDDA